jgi:hypothetical protein
MRAPEASNTGTLPLQQHGCAGGGVVNACSYPGMLHHGSICNRTPLQLRVRVAAHHNHVRTALASPHLLPQSWPSCWATACAR